MDATLEYAHTYGGHTFAQMTVDGKAQQIDVYYRASGETYKTTADDDKVLRRKIIQAFNDLF